MNDTTRDDIYQFDDAEIAEHPIVQRLINEAVAARDAEIREALMQPEVVKEAAKEVGALDDRFYDGSAIDAMQCALEAALGYIGLSDDTGGQG